MKNLRTSKYTWVPAFLGITIALFFSSWLMFHTFSYDPTRHEMKIAFKLWSDFGAHVPLIRSFSMGDNLARLTRGLMPEYPIFPGEPIRYHFLFYLFTGLLEKIGFRIDWALNVPSILGFFFLLVSIYFLTHKLFGSKWVALLAVIFFLLNGSLGFVRFFTLHPLSPNTLSDIIHAKDFPAFAPWGPGEVTAFWNLNIYTNQRHLAAAFSLIIFFILTCLRLDRMPIKKQLPWAFLWAVIIGALPYFHQPALLIMAVIMATYILCFPKLRLFLLTCGLLTTALVIPQLLIARGASSPIEWYPGYIIHNEILKEKGLVALWHMLTFWWQNFGAHSVLILAGFFIIPKRARLVFLPLLPLFIIPNLVKFSVEASANHKFFNFVLILGAMISAYAIVWFSDQVTKLSRHWIIAILKYVTIGALVVFLTLSGIIDLFVIRNDTKGSVADIAKSETATWILKNTPRHAIFLNSSYLYHPASLAGRFIFLGWPYFAWSAGYKENRMPIMDQMYEEETAPVRCNLLAKYHISYVTVEEVKDDKNLPRIDLAYYLKTYTPIFVSANKRYAIFKTEALCSDHQPPKNK